MGIFHAEIKLTPNGPRLIEIATRLAGDNILDLIYIAKGVNFYELMIRSYLGEDLQDPNPSSCCYTGIRFLTLPKDRNTYSQIIGQEKIRNLPGVFEFELLAKPNTDIGDPYYSAVGRVAKVLIKGDSYSEVKKLLEEIDNIVEFV